MKPEKFSFIELSNQESTLQEEFKFGHMPLQQLGNTCYKEEKKKKDDFKTGEREKKEQKYF